MKSPLALVEVPYHHPRTGENQRVWAVVRTGEAASGLRAYRVVFIREPTPQERVSVEACLSHSAEEGQKSFNLQDMLARTGSVEGRRTLGAILRGKP
jgi:hypothetical protein